MVFDHRIFKIIGKSRAARHEWGGGAGSICAAFDWQRAMRPAATVLVNRDLRRCPACIVPALRNREQAPATLLSEALSIDLQPAEEHAALVRQKAAEIGVKYEDLIILDNNLNTGMVTYGYGYKHDGR